MVLAKLEIHPQNLYLIKDHFTTISGHFCVNYVKIFHKMEVQVGGGRFCLPHRLVLTKIFEIPAPLMTTSFHDFGSMLRSERCNTLYRLYNY